MTNPNDPIGIGEFQAFAILKGELALDKMVEISTHSKGLTKREYFAAMAMQGLILHREKELDYSSKLPARVIACMAIAQADALIEELSK